MWGSALLVDLLLVRLVCYVWLLVTSLDVIAKTLSDFCYLLCLIVYVALHICVMTVTLSYTLLLLVPTYLRHIGLSSRSLCACLTNHILWHVWPIPICVIIDNWSAIVLHNLLVLLERVIFLREVLHWFFVNLFQSMHLSLFLLLISILLPFISLFKVYLLQLLPVFLLFNLI